MNYLHKRKVNDKLINMNNGSQHNTLSMEGILLTGLLIFINSSVMLSYNQTYLLIALTISVYLFYRKGYRLHSHLIVVLVFLTILSFFHYLEFAFFSYWTNLGTLVRFSLPYFAICVIGNRFPHYYVKVMYYFTLISFVFYIPTLIVPGFIDNLLQLPNILGTSAFGQGTNFFIYTVEGGMALGLYRNSGPFAEPGMFAIYLIIALLFNTIIAKKINEISNIIFSIALITTFSTVGYIVLFLFLISITFISIKKRRKFHTLLLLSLLIYGGIYAYYNLDFMGEKIDSQFSAYEAGAVYAGRIGSAYEDFTDIFNYPLTGRGRNVETRFDDFIESTDLQVILRFHRTNGLTDFLVKYGILFGIFYFYYMYKSIRLMCIYHGKDKLFAIPIVTIIIIAGFSQIIFQHSIMIAMTYMYLIYATELNTPIISKGDVEVFSHKNLLLQVGKNNLAIDKSSFSQ